MVSPQGKKGPRVTRRSMGSSAFSPNSSSRLRPAGLGQMGLGVPQLGIKQSLL